MTDNFKNIKNIKASSGIITLGILLTLCLAGCQSQKEAEVSPKLMSVKTTTVAQQMIANQVELSGTVVPQPNRSARVTSLVAGVLSYVGPKVGDTVEKNQVVARLEDSIQKSQVHQNRAGFSLAEANLEKVQHGARPQELEQAQAAVDAARANEINAQQNKDRFKKLFEQEISAGSAYDLAVSQEKVTQSQLRAAEANLSLVARGLRPEDRAAARAQADQAAGVLEQSQANLNLTQLKSPIKGLVVERYLDVGEQAGPATPVLLVVDPTVVNVTANLPVGYNDKLAPQQQVEISLPDSKEMLTGKILKIGMKLDPLTNTLPVQIEIANYGLKLKFGMVVKANVVIDKHMSLALPKQCLIGSADDPNKLMVNLVKDGVSNPVAVQTGITDGEMVEIKSGLRQGDQVALDVNYELPAGTKVAAR